MASENPAAGMQNSGNLEDVIHSSAFQVLKTAASHPALNEDLALSLLQRADLPAEIFEPISKNPAVAKSRKVKLAIVGHAKAPRYISISLLRQLFTFDLMKVALTPAISGDIKAAADEILINKLETLSLGEKVSLARRASGRVVGALLLDPDVRVIQAALENGRLTEALVIKALMRPDSPVVLIRTVCDHGKWSLRREIRMALLRNEKTPPTSAEEFARNIPLPALKEILHGSRLPQWVKARLLRERDG